MITELLNNVHEQNQPELCTLSGFTPYESAPSGALFTKATITQAGRVAKIKVYQGSGQQLTPDRVGQELCFNLKSYQAQNGNIYISGFWNDRAAPQPQQNSQQPQQAHQQAAQSTNAAQGMQSIDSQIRALAVESAAILVAAGRHDLVELYGLADCIADYIQNGMHPTGVAGAHPTRDEDFPYEPGEQG